MSYPTNTGAIIAWLYPEGQFGIDYTIELINGSVAISQWADVKLGPQPTPEQVVQQELLWRNSTTWAAQAKSRKGREAKAALALPDSDDPVIMRRKLNAALHLIQR
jgi:hypothetical protein